MQLDHFNSNFKKSKHEIVIICDSISNAPNIGSIFRTADTFNIKEIKFCGESFNMGRVIQKTSRSTHKWIRYNFEDSITETINNLKKEDFYIIGLEITSNSIPLNKYTLSKNVNKIAVILGNENFGIQESVLDLCDTATHINMYGKNSSMNVVNATNILLYELTKQLNS